MMNQKNLPFILFTLGVFILLTLPVLLQDGMFMDGVQYACVSKNMAAGQGSFWQPFFSQTWWKSGSNVFLEHPPLGLWMQSLFFRVLGSSFYTERFYCFVMAVLNALMIVLIWRIFNKNSAEIKRLSWMPVLFWITVPVCFWSFQNNMLENTMSLFTLAAVFFMLKACFADSKKLPLLIISGVFVFFATLTKGLPGLFPLLVIPLYWIFFRNTSFYKMALRFIIVVTVPVAIYLLILLDNDAAQSLRFYFFDRLLYRISDEPTAASRFETPLRLLAELLPVMLLTFFTFLFLKIKKSKIARDTRSVKSALFFICIGLSASMPLMLTMVQKGFYFVPSLPFFAIGFALLLAVPISEIVFRIAQKKNAFKIIMVVSLLFLVGTLFFSVIRIGGFSRDKDVLQDVYTLGKVIPENTVVNIDDEVYNEWSVHCYLLRYFNISIKPSDKYPTCYYIRKKERKIDSLSNLQLVILPTKKYDLYRIGK